MRICWPQATMILLVIILGVSSMLSGCGKKGPLYIPKNAAKQLQQQ
ncbi:MAG: lipoprotein [Gammaproteobacteria bacterium]|nr:lipoprotein [Gammaproteobacteria bacterium]MCW9031152.1 lipoprotein [Gammaproteobacteria bacterium]